MPNKKNSITLFVSLIVTLLFITCISIFFNKIAIHSSENTIANLLYPGMFSLALIFFIVFQGLLRTSLNNKVLYDRKPLIELKTDKFTFSEKLWIYAFIIVIYFIPIIKKSSVESFNSTRIILFAITLVVVEILLRISEKTLKIIFLKDGILVSGFDMRLDFPVGNPIHNPSGFYSYSVIDGFLPFEDHIELFIEYEQGKILAITDETEKNQILDILKQKKIKVRKYV